MVRIVMVIGWLLGALLLTFIPSAYTLSGFIRRWTRFFKGPIVSRGKVVVVTGASSGIGRQIALEYGRRGAKLVLVARREHLLREVAELCKERGAEDAKIVPADLSREEDCKKMINFTVTTFGRLDILVNNAGTTISRFFEDAESPSEFRYVMNVDFWGNIHPTLHALKHLQRTKGQIVVTSSVAAYIPYPYLTFYTAAKGAIVNFYDTLRVESLLRKEVGITLAFPGFVKTELTEKEPPVKYMDYCMVETNKRGLDLPPKTCQYFHKNVCLRETFPQWKVATSSGVLWSGFEVKALKSNSHYHIK